MRLLRPCFGVASQSLAMTVITMFFTIALPASSIQLPALSAAEEPHFHGGPEVGEEAPLFTLKDLRGRLVRLEDFKKKKPVVLVTGSYSCPVYRHRHAGLERLFQRYAKRAAFFVLYTVEAHPKGDVSPYADREWVTEENVREGILVRQPASYEERVRLAVRSQAALNSQVPVLVDEMDNAVWQQYGSAPNAAYYIDSRGKVQIRQDWFDPLQFEKEFLTALQEEPARW